MVTTRDWLSRPRTTSGRAARRFARRQERLGLPHRSRIPELCALERRELLTVLAKQPPILVSPGVLPPTGQTLPVTFSGVVVSTRSKTPGAFFQVTDEYRQYEPHGSVSLTPIGLHDGNYDFAFDFTIDFPTKRSTKTYDGRHFDVLIGAKDTDNTSGRTVEVLVPKTYPPPQLGQAIVAGPTVKATHTRLR